MTTLYGSMFLCLLSTIILAIILSFTFGIRSKKDFLNIVLVNILTNPLVVSLSIYINVRYGLEARNNSIIFLELFAIITEGFIYKKVLQYKKINPFLFSLLLNLCSYFIGSFLIDLII